MRKQGFRHWCYISQLTPSNQNIHLYLEKGRQLPEGGMIGKSVLQSGGSGGA